MNRPCWICSGKGNSLCGNCNRARLERMAKYNIDSETAAEQLREMRVELMPPFVPYDPTVKKGGAS